MALKGRRSSFEERVQAVRLIESGWSYAAVAELFEVGESTVLEWMRKYRAGGLDALATRPTPGRPASLSDRQMRELYALIEGCEPRHLGLGFALWTRRLVRDLIHSRFGVDLSVQHVGRILKDLGLSPQRPLYRAHQQDPGRVERWKDEEYPAIRERAAAEDAVVLFADEAAVRTDHHAGTTWTPVGRTPAVSATGDRHTVMMISAISAQGALRFRLHEGSFTSRHFIEFCRRLLGDFDRKVFLIVGGGTVHTSKMTREFVAGTEGDLELFFLPPYSPELNPDEWVWKNVKHDRIGRSSVRGIEELRAVAGSALHRLQKAPHVIRGFFRDPKLSYILG